MSPFNGHDNAAEEEDEEATLPLTRDNVEKVLDELRPFLRSDGGDCRIVSIDGPVVRLELEGACSSCSASSVTLKMGIERTLRQRIPEVQRVEAVDPGQEPLTRLGIEEVLDGIRPFLKVSKGTIAMRDFSEGSTPKLVLAMAGPPSRSAAVRTEVVNRMKRKYPLLQDIEIQSEDDSAFGLQ